MILVKHKNYDEYAMVQISRSKRRTNYGRRLLWWADEEMVSVSNRLIHLYVDDIGAMVCHGCRIGLEVDVFQKLNPKTKVFGTDIYGKAYKYNRVYFREMDFDTVPMDWVEYFDVIYSNSIDHSRDPINTLLAWKSELKKGGICYCVFHWGSQGNQADCFSLSLDCIEICDGVPKYEIEIGEIAREIGMEVVYFKRAYSQNEGRGYSSDAILRK